MQCIYANGKNCNKNCENCLHKTLYNLFLFYVRVFFFRGKKAQRHCANVHSLRQSEFHGLAGTGLGCTNHTTDVQYIISKATTKWKTWPQTVCSNAHVAVACIFKHERTNFQPKTLSTQQ